MEILDIQKGGVLTLEAEGTIFSFEFTSASRLEIFNQTHDRPLKLELTNVRLKKNLNLFAPASLTKAIIAGDTVVPLVSRDKIVADVLHESQFWAVTIWPFLLTTTKSEFMLRRFLNEDI